LKEIIFTHFMLLINELNNKYLDLVLAHLFVGSLLPTNSYADGYGILLFVFRYGDQRPQPSVRKGYRHPAFDARLSKDDLHNDRLTYSLRAVCRECSSVCERQLAQYCVRSRKGGFGKYCVSGSRCCGNMLYPYVFGPDIWDSLRAQIEDFVVRSFQIVSEDDSIPVVEASAVVVNRPTPFVRIGSNVTDLVSGMEHHTFEFRFAYGAQDGSGEYGSGSVVNDHMARAENIGMEMDQASVGEPEWVCPTPGGWSQLTIDAGQDQGVSTGDIVHGEGQQMASAPSIDSSWWRPLWFWLGYQ